MNISTNGKIFLTSVEGICLSPYLDSKDIKTIAIGATKSEIPNIANMPWETEITMERAFILLDSSLKKYVDAVQSSLKIPVKQHQFDALVSICYNIGCSGLKTSLFMRRINSAYELAEVGDAILMWRKPPEIIGRRRKEVNLYKTGEYGDGKANVFPVNPTTHKPQYARGRNIVVQDYLTIE